MKQRVGLMLALGILVCGVTLWAANVDFSGDWAVAGAQNGASITIHQHGDSFRVVMHNAEGSNFGAHFVADGQVQQMRAQGTLQRTVQASWEGETLKVESRVLADSRIRRQVSLDVSMGQDGQLHVVMTRGNGRKTRTNNLVLVRQ